MMTGKNRAFVGVILFGELLLFLIFVKWVLHGSADLYWLIIPWALFGVIMVARPNWIIRMMHATEDKAKRDMERLDKWTPPGFP
jgi:hypothetical protein